MTGFGQTGPYRERAGYDYAIQGMGGMMSITGERDDAPGGGPQTVGVAMADLFTGLYATTAILAALRPRPHRRGPAHRHGAARQPGGDARQPRTPTTSTPASRRNAPATRTRTWCRTRSSRSPTATSSSRSATTASTRASAKSPGGPTWQATCVSRAMPTGSATVDSRPAAGGREDASTRQTGPGPRTGRGAVRSDQRSGRRLRRTPRQTWQMTVDRRIRSPAGSAGRKPDQAVGDPGPIPHAPPLLGADTEAVLAEFGIAPDEIAALRQSGAI